jgi:hypothetical protein
MLLNLISSIQPPTVQGSSPACKPFRLPAGVKSFQDYCRLLSTANDTEWDDIYRKATGPTTGAPLPLSQCVLGCIVGTDSYLRGLRWGSGAWSGKCLRSNKVRRQPIMAVMNTVIM